jgi:hypothetical protein
MEWSAQSLIERVLKPSQPPWWAGRSDERSLEDALTTELSQDIPDFRRLARKLFFFSTWGSSSIDGRAGSVGVELKYTNLSLRRFLMVQYIGVSSGS